MVGRVVSEAFVHRYGHGGTVEVPAGARVTPIPDEDRVFWVDPATWKSGSLERWDAEYRGIRVPLDNTKEAE